MCVCGSCWETSWVKLSFRSWHFKPDCAKSLLDKTWCGFDFRVISSYSWRFFFSEQRTSPKDLLIRVLPCPLKSIKCSISGSWKSNGLWGMKLIRTKFSGQSTGQVCKGSPDKLANAMFSNEQMQLQQQGCLGKVMFSVAASLHHVCLPRW